MATVPAPDQPYQWSGSSFRFIAGSDEGFGQAHYAQHLNSEANRVWLDTISRKWVYGIRNNNVLIRNSIFGTAAFNEARSKRYNK